MDLEDGKQYKRSNKLNKSELIRRVKLFSLQVQNGNSSALLILLSTLTFIICCLNFMMNMQTMQQPYSLMKSDINSRDLKTNKKNFWFDNNERELCLASHQNLLLDPKDTDKHYLKSNKLSFLEVPVINNILVLEEDETNLFLSLGDQETMSKIKYTLNKLEFNMNKGWNNSLNLIQPLGDFDYVRRDLPVYKAAFESLNFKVNKRPKGGLLFIQAPGSSIEVPSQFVSTTNYNSILCLSFNTDHCLNEENFHHIPTNKRINRIKYLRDILWSKDKFCKTSSGALKGWNIDEVKEVLNSSKYKKSDFEYTFPCWIMPSDHKSLMSYARNHPEKKFISKPKSLGGGKGIYVVDSYEDLKREKRVNSLIQVYLKQPHLIVKEDGQGYKWDMRTYVLVTSITPFRGYLYKRGLVRIATQPYDENAKCSGNNENKTGCLTNTSINKKVKDAKLKDITWSFFKLKKHIGAKQFNTLFAEMKRVIGLTLLSAETGFYQKYSKDSSTFKCQNCYQLLGVDVIVTADMKPKIVEVNGEPSLKLTSNGRTHYDITKKSMAKDLVNIVFNKNSVFPSEADLTETLLRISKCLNLEDEESEFVIGKDHLEYILNSLRERQNIGDFSMIYPTTNKDIQDYYEMFLRVQHLKEQANNIEGAHYTKRRLFLHKLMYLISQQGLLTTTKGHSSSP